MVRTLISAVFALSLHAASAQYEGAFFLSEENGAKLRDHAKAFHNGLVGLDTTALVSDWKVVLDESQYSITVNLPQGSNPGTLQIGWVNGDGFGDLLHTWKDISGLGAINTLILKRTKDGVETIFMGDEAMAEVPGIVPLLKLAVSMPCPPSRN